MQKFFDEAYLRSPEQFRAALIDARDILGTFLADTWTRLNRNDLTYADVAEEFLAVEHAHTGGRYRLMFEQNFRMRDIGLVDVGPQLAPLDEHSHANSIRTQLPID